MNENLYKLGKKYKICQKLDLFLIRIRNKFLTEQQIKNKIRNTAIEYCEENPKVKQILIEKGKKLLDEELKQNNKNSHLFGSYNGEIRCLRCKCLKNKDSELYKCPIKKEYICGIDEWEIYKKKVSTGAYNPYYSWLSSTPDKIKNIINDEEKLFNNTVEKGRILCKKKWNNIKDLSGKDLAWLHHTHGLELEVIEEIYNECLTFKQKKDYKLEYNKHNETGKIGFVPKLIKIKVI